MEDSEREIVNKKRLWKRAIWRKWHKFVWSGLRWILVGLFIIAIGLAFSKGPYSPGSLVVGLGVIIVIIGIIRLLIGVINPPSPVDIHELRPPSE
jgi:hypothetical protein